MTHLHEILEERTLGQGSGEAQPHKKGPEPEQPIHLFGQAFAACSAFEIPHGCRTVSIRNG